MEFHERPFLVLTLYFVSSIHQFHFGNHERDLIHYDLKYNFEQYGQFQSLIDGCCGAHG